MSVLNPVDKTPHWELLEPIDAIVFDCDGTLSTLEGIDELAKMNQVGDIVEKLTAEAMGKTGINPGVYKKRLDLVKPTRAQVMALGTDYFANMVADLLPVLAALQELNKAIYIVSAGLLPAVREFAKHLKIPQQHVFAVDAQFDNAGNYVDFDPESPLINPDGKYIVVEKIQHKYPRVLHVGDGLNDYSTHNMVSRFVGYGGAYYRANMAAMCHYYILSASIAALLPLSLTKNEVGQLSAEAQVIYHKGLNALYEKQVIFN